MRFLERTHRRYVYKRRVRILADAVALLLPPDARILDVGCGDGLIDSMIIRQRSDVSIEGIEVVIRPNVCFPVMKYNGLNIPFNDNAFDTAICIDVLHHAKDPQALLREIVRVSRKHIIIKDHLLRGIFAGPVLRFMDRVGNESYNVDLPFNYWQEDRWFASFRELGLSIEQWNTRIRLYPWWANWIFGRSLHFIARLSKKGPS